MRRISILGSTGSIGCSTLQVVDHLDDVSVVGLAAGSNSEKLAEQIGRYKPEVVSVCSPENADGLAKELSRLGIDPPKIENGPDGLTAVATHPDAEVIVAATAGSVGFIPTLRAIESGKNIALANKETLVMAGELMTAAAKRSGSEILPVDSEHNAIHQCLRGERMSEVRRLILTASGGPFRTKTKEQIAEATIEQALDHPNWKMGRKITIDSATLMNKGLEVIEAKWLFGVGPGQISVVVHPQSVIHSMVEFIDGSIMAQMGVTNMCHPIQYALTYPDRTAGVLEPLDLTKLSKLEFEEPDAERFPCLELAFDALTAGGTMPTVLNAANEIAVREFLDGNIKLPDIAVLIDAVMAEHTALPADSLEAVLAADEWARSRAIMKLGPEAVSA